MQHPKCYFFSYDTGQCVFVKSDSPFTLQKPTKQLLQSFVYRLRHLEPSPWPVGAGADVPSRQGPQTSAVPAFFPSPAGSHHPVDVRHLRHAEHHLPPPRAMGSKNELTIGGGPRPVACPNLKHHGP